MAYNSRARPDRQTRSTRIASVLVVGVTIAMLTVLLRTFSDMVGAVVIGAVGAVLLTVTLWLSRPGDNPAMSVGVGLLVLPAGAGMVGSALVAVVLLVEQVFPVEEEALISVGWLLTISHTGVVVGCSIAVFGLTVAVRNVVSRDTLSRCLRAAVAGGTVPIVTVLGFLLIALRTGTTPDATVVPPVANLVGTLFAPVLAVAGSLPLPVAGLFLVAVTVLLVVAVGRLLTRLPSTRFGDPTSSLGGAVAGGAVATVGIITAADWLYARAVAELLRRFPVAIEGDVREVSNAVATSFGESTVLLLVAVLCIEVAALTMLLLRVGIVRDVVSSDTVGSSVAGSGVFVATIFAGTLGASVLLVVGGVLASLLIWDAGRFGTTLTAEIGSVPARRVEFVHSGGTLLVGLAGAAVALLVVSWFPAEPDIPTTTELLALCSVVAGLLSLVVALR